MQFKFRKQCGKIEKIPILGLRNVSRSARSRFQMLKQLILEFCSSCPPSTLEKVGKVAGLVAGLKVGVASGPSKSAPTYSLGVAIVSRNPRFCDQVSLFYPIENCIILFVGKVGKKVGKVGTNFQQIHQH